ncbi:zinc-ribbon domain-containing protein [Parasulfitobacter algicola]|uniref:Zinc-ribbon domain-containing protein n=1 Tax=Parasulfitobacter algicola TaxID=2614809 RepID=A0ABX2IMT3_9RHOB|nr:zinc-ribbon domain-containing protein [Sulfitobacter algicola]NSX53850.1 zinc-ribbon domain-containing protein [Sulfitobacter algicola]
MRLKCPNCKAQYEVSDDVIPEAGRDVQCSNCGNTWFQGPDALAHADDDDEVDTVADDALAEETEQVASEPELKSDGGGDEDDDEGPLPESARPAPKRRELPDEIASVLREEAEFEVRARDAEPDVIETQTDLGLVAESADAKPVGAPILGAAISSGLTGTTQPGDLPNVETINSTLIGNPDASTSQTAKPNNGFRNGFLTVMLIGVLALAAYVYAPQIANGVPALSGPLSGYAETVDAFRLWIDGALQPSTTS